MKGWYWYAIAFVAGALVCFVAMLYWSNGAQSRLRADLDAAGAALADAVASNERLAASNSKLRSDLDDAGARATEQQRLLVTQQRAIDKQQLTIAEQRRELDGLKRSLADFASSLAGGLGDLRSRTEAIRDGFARLYAIYHSSP